MVQCQPQPTVEVVAINTLTGGQRFVRFCYLFALGITIGTLAFGALLATIFASIGLIFGGVVSSPCS